MNCYPDQGGNVILRVELNGSLADKFRLIANEFYELSQEPDSGLDKIGICDAFNDIGKRVIWEGLSDIFGECYGPA